MQLVFEDYFDYTQHPAHVPEVAFGRDKQHHRVAIVGAGPTGLVLALTLAKYGVASVLINSGDTVSRGSRGGVITNRSLEILASLGAIGPVMRAGFPMADGHTYYHGRQVHRLERSPSEATRFPMSLSLPQNQLEHLLFQEAEKYPDLIEIRWLSSVYSLRNYSEHCELGVRTPEIDYTLSADWVVAADGVRSTLRKQLGLKLAGTSFAAKFVVIDIRIDAEGLPTGRRCWFDPPSNPGMSLVVYSRPNNIMRLEYQISPEIPDAEALDTETVFGKVRQHLDLMEINQPWEPVWMSVYQATAAKLEEFVHDRVIFIGDAAHLFPSLGARSMNSSIEDSHSLGWRLALLLQGKAGRKILDSYDVERSQVAADGLELSTRSAAFVAPRSKVGEVLRDATLSLADEQPLIASLIDPRQHTPIPLADSPLSMPDQPSAWSSSLAPGELAFDQPVTMLHQGSERSGYLSELLGNHFTVLAATTDDAGAETPLLAMAEQWRQLVPIQVYQVIGKDSILGLAEGRVHDFTGRIAQTYGFDFTQCAVYLIRPDGYVQYRGASGVARDLIDGIDAALRRVTLGKE